MEGGAPSQNWSTCPPRAPLGDATGARSKYFEVWQRRKRRPSLLQLELDADETFNANSLTLRLFSAILQKFESI